jgi:hypothetical protein
MRGYPPHSSLRNDPRGPEPTRERLSGGDCDGNLWRGLRAALGVQSAGTSCVTARVAFGGRVRAVAVKRQRRGSIGARNRASPTVPVNNVK